MHKHNTNLSPRESKFIDECLKPNKLTKIEEFKLDDHKGGLITVESGSGKTYVCKQV